jgi:hypothetical protein
MRADTLSLLRSRFSPVVFIPAALALGLILYFSVEVPWGDEWNLPGRLYQRIVEGTVTYKDFFRLHAETRLAFPRLVFAAIGLTIGWKVRVFMFLSWCSVLLTLVFLLNLLPADDTEQNPFMLLYTGVLLSLLLFSPSQSITQLWGSALCVFIPPLCIAGCLLLQATRAPYGFKVIASAILSIISTFSFASGMMCWLLGCPLIGIWLNELAAMSRREKVRIAVWTALYLGIAVITVSFYFWDYKKPPHHPSFGVVLQDPLLGLAYFAAWLGAPFTFAGKSATVFAISVGVFILFGLSVSLLAVSKQRRVSEPGILASYYPWVSLTAYGIVSGLLTTVGRLGFGLKGALAWRYASISLWVTIGLVGFLCTLWYGRGDKPRNAAAVMFAIIIGAVSILAALSWVFGISRMQEVNDKMLQSRLSVRLIDVAPSNPLLTRVHSVPEWVRRRRRLLLAHGILDDDPMGGWLSGKLKAPDGDKAGWFRINRYNAQRIRATGWAMLPPRGIPPDCVILCRRDENGDLEVISGFLLKVTRPDVAKAQNNPRLLLSGFDYFLDIAVSEDEQFSMFAVDLEGRHAYKLSQSKPSPGKAK